MAEDSFVIVEHIVITRQEYEQWERTLIGTWEHERTSIEAKLEAARVALRETIHQAAEAKGWLTK